MGLERHEQGPEDNTKALRDEIEEMADTLDERCRGLRKWFKQQLLYANAKLSFTESGSTQNYYLEFTYRGERYELNFYAENGKHKVRLNEPRGKLFPKGSTMAGKSMTDYSFEEPRAYLLKEGIEIIVQR